MSRSNTSSWFPLAKFVSDQSAKRECKGILFGPAKQAERLFYLYPNENVKKYETVIWSPREHKTISLKSYEKAHQDQDAPVRCRAGRGGKDAEALGKITKLGIPLGLTFGGAISLKKEM